MGAAALHACGGRRKAARACCKLQPRMCVTPKNHFTCIRMNWARPCPPPNDTKQCGHLGTRSAWQATPQQHTGHGGRSTGSHRHLARWPRSAARGTATNQGSITSHRVQMAFTTSSKCMYRQSQSVYPQAPLGRGARPPGKSAPRCLPMVVHHTPQGRAGCKAGWRPPRHSKGRAPGRRGYKGEGAMEMVQAPWEEAATGIHGC